MHGTTRGTGRAARRQAERELAAERLDAVRGLDRAGWVPDGPSTPAGRVVRDSMAARLVDRLPVSLRSSRWSVPVTAMLAMLAITGLVAVVVAVRTASAAPGVPVPVRTGSSPTASTPSSEPPAPVGGAVGTGVAADRASTHGEPAASVPTQTGEVVVHVVGEVATPGLVRLRVGARVDDALAAAGGATATADLGRLNLARQLVDGEQVVVPRPGEELVAAPAPAAPPAGSAGSGGNAGAPVSLNTATLAELDALPGIGPVLAQRILDWRAQNGRFTSVDELGEVSGIGERVLERLRPMVQV